MTAVYVHVRRRMHSQLEREMDRAIHRAQADCHALEIHLDEFDAHLRETRAFLTAAGYLRL
jgi:hypothetical protein